MCVRPHAARRDQQHLQFVAHAIDRDDRLVVERRRSPGTGSTSISTTFGPPWSTTIGRRIVAPGAPRMVAISAPSRRTRMATGS